MSQFFRAEGVSVFDLTVLNSGNLPITAIGFNFGNKSYVLNGLNFPLLPEKNGTGWAWLWLNVTSKVFVSGTAYPLSIQTSYADGSTSIIKALYLRSLIEALSGRFK